MKTHKLIRLHKRATVILEMIQLANELAVDAAQYVNAIKASKLDYRRATLPYYQKRLSKYTNVSYRLQRYYADVMKRIVEPIIINMSERKQNLSTVNND